MKNYFKNFGPRTGISWRPNEKTVVRAGYGASAIPFPDNRYAFAFPVKQNYSGSAANGFQRAGSMATGFPAPTLANIPSDGILPVSGSLLNSTYDVIPPGLHEGHAVFVERGVPAAAAVRLHRRHRLRREQGRRSRGRSGHERQPGLRIRQRRPSAIRAVQSDRHEPHPHEPGQVALQRPAGQGRSPVP